MLDMTPILSLTTALFAITTFVAFVKIWFMKERARTLELERRSLEGYKLSHEELSRVSWSYRNMFDHFHAYVPTDEKLAEFVWRLGVTFPRYVEELPHLLRPLPPDVPEAVRETAVPQLPVEFRDGGELDSMVKAINDPVFKRLWEIRTPAAIGEMLRHGVFLSFGYPHSVALWKAEGVNLELKLGEPGYANWGCRTLESLDSYRQTWHKWRTK